MSLTYTTLLSLVPFLAVMFSVLTALGARDVAAPFLAWMLEPLGPEAPLITERIVDFVEGLRVGILGAAGTAFLFYYVLNLVASMEDALNLIWRAPRSRTWSERFSAYLSVVLVGPVMVFTALALLASAQSHWFVERVMEIGILAPVFALVTRIMPFVLLWATFTFLYKLMPYTRVRLVSAVLGGATAAILWQLAGIGFTAFVATSTRYAAIYSSFAILILFLFWLYICWLIFLVGAEIAYFHQHPRAFVAEAIEGGRTHSYQEWLALSTLIEVTRRHLSQGPPWQTAELAAFLDVPSLEELLDKFIRAGILLKAAEPEGVALARPPENVTVKEVLDLVSGGPQEKLDGGPAADVLQRREQAVQKSLEGVTLRALATETTPRSLRLAQGAPPTLKQESGTHHRSTENTEEEGLSAKR
jgi:membrane protein